MARLHPETVDKLIELLILPVGGEEDDRPQVMEPAIQKVSEDLGWLVFEDDKWYEYDPRRIEDTLEPWISDEVASQFDSVAMSSQAPEFLTWLENLIVTWRSGEAGAAGEEGDHALLGLENPHFAPDEVPGTQFYKYLNNEYLYAATADAQEGEWKTLEERYDEHAVATDSVSPTDGTLRGYPYSSSVLPGTEYYRLDNGVYLYGPDEFGEAEDWQPYEHWQEQADREQAAAELMESLDSLIAVLQSQLEPRK